MEKKQLQLQPRLQMLADLVPEGARLADVGTDHGYLPVWLLQRGRIRTAIASDIGAEPLHHAQRTAQEQGIDSVDFRLCDGLQGIKAEETDTVVIAGMGGETIAHILQQAPWTADGAHTLLLQPMTKAEQLRLWLSQNGYRFTGERLVRDKDFLYPIMQVTGGAQAVLGEPEQYSGVLLGEDPLYSEYLQHQIYRLQRAIDGRSRASSETNRVETCRLETICRALEEKERRLCHGDST